MEKCKVQNTVSSGYNSLDNIVGGFKPGTLVGVFSSVYMGRTSFLINLLINCSYKYRIRFIPNLELPFRIYENMNKISNSYKRENIFISDFNGPKDDELIDLILNCNEDIILIDDWDTFNEDSFFERIKNVAISKKITIIFTRELSRAIQYRFDKRPILDDCKGIDQKCDTVIFIYRDEYWNASYVKDGNDFGYRYHPEYSQILPKVNVELIVAKNVGKTGTAHLFFDRRIGKYFE